MNETTIDARSDTVTQPTQAMKEAMAAAPLGDDVLGDDPTVKKLEEMNSKMFGKQAGLFFPTGTMSNLCALMAWTNRGEAVLTGDLNHIIFWEQGGLSQVGNIPSFQLPVLEDGTFDLDLVAKKLDTFAPVGRHIDQHHAKISVISLETPHTQNKGVCYPLKFADDMRKLCDQHKVGLHLDGARCINAIHKYNLWNKIADSDSEYPSDDEYSGIKKFAKPYDTISVCLSKSVGAPVGSILLGPTEFIAKARRIRKVLGGTMRQSGVLAAAGIYGLQNNAPNMIKDNERAKRIADFAEKNLNVKSVHCDTNAVFIAVEDNYKVVEKLQEKRVLAVCMPPNYIRMMTHLHIGDDEVEKIIKALKEAV